MIKTMNKGKTINRFLELDILKTYAISGMIIFHSFYLLDFFNILTNEMYEGSLGILALSVQLSFLGLVGLGLSISANRSKSTKSFQKKQLKRTLVIFLAGSLVSLSTWLFLKEGFVKFGVLQLIALSILILTIFVKNSLFVGFIGLSSYLTFPIINTIDSSNPLTYILGFNPKDIIAVDYFPLLKWIPVICVGILIGNLFYKNRSPHKTKIHNRLLRSFMFLGQHSLAIYLIHVPLIILGLILSGLLPFQALLS
jgi:uncharacterized membrane protein